MIRVILHGVMGACVRSVQMDSSLRCSVLGLSELLFQEEELLKLPSVEIVTFCISRSKQSLGVPPYFGAPLVRGPLR